MTPGQPGINFVGVMFPKLVLIIKKIITTIVVDIYQAFNAKPFMEVILPNLCHKPHKLGTDTIILIGGMWAKSRLKDLSKVSYLLNRRTWVQSQDV